MKRYDLEYIAYGSEGANEMREAIEGDWVDAEEAIARIDALQKENARLRALVSRGAEMTGMVPEMGHNAYAAECAAEEKTWRKR